jgi:hypothetical protein
MQSRDNSNVDLNLNRSGVGQPWEWSDIQNNPGDSAHFVEESHLLQTGEHTYSEATEDDLEQEGELPSKKRVSVIDVKAPSVHTAFTVNRISGTYNHPDLFPPRLEPFNDLSQQEQNYYYYRASEVQTNSDVQYNIPDPKPREMPAENARNAKETYVVQVPSTLDRSKDTATRKKAKRCCCCFKTCWGCCLMFMLILIAIGVALYFIFPQIPSIDVSEPYIPAGSSGLTINGQPVAIVDAATVLNSRNFNLSLSMAGDVSIFSPSFINFGVRTLELYVQPKLEDGSMLPNFIGFGKRNDLRFPSRTTTNFTIPINLSYNASINAFSLISDPALQLFSRACLATSQAKIPVQVRARLEISALSWTGFWPSFSWETQQSCPDRAYIDQMIAKFGR